LNGKQMAETASVSEGYISQVKAALDSGQIPPVSVNSEVEEDVNPAVPLNEYPANELVEEAQPEEELFPENEDSPAPPPKEKSQAKYPLTSVKNANAKVSMPGVASALKLVQVPVVCPLTPIMMNARAVAQYELGWIPDMPWEDFIDTVFYHYFKALGFTLQGYIKDKVVEEAESTKTSVQSQKVSGNGGTHLSPDEMKELAKQTASYIIALSQGG